VTCGSVQLFGLDGAKGLASAVRKNRGWTTLVSVNFPNCLLCAQVRVPGSDIIYDRSLCLV
jgi:hypothetical protein